MNKSGLDGLKKHLTSNALKIVNGFESVSSLAVIGFDYQGKMTGTIELKMIKEDEILMLC